MKEFKMGMYVRCPIDKLGKTSTRNELENPREFLFGQIVRSYKDLEKYDVNFYDIDGVRNNYPGIPNIYRFDIDEIKRCNIRPGTVVKLRNGSFARILRYKDKDEADEYYEYYVGLINDNKNAVQVVSEKNIICSFTGDDPKPYVQMSNYEFYNPDWYFNRRHVADLHHTLKNSKFGIEVLLGSRVFLFEHQIDTILRGITETPCRLMLADEVGLGKTVEASVIMKGIKQKHRNLNTLIIVPDSLTFQWQNELRLKLFQKVPVYDDNMKRIEGDLIFPLEKLCTESGRRLLNLNWDMCIVDEAHRLLRLSKEYDAVKYLSEKTDNLLLVSATPIQEMKKEFFGLLTLLDPKYYSNISKEDFENLLDKQEVLKGAINKLVKSFGNISKSTARKYLISIEKQINDAVYREIIKGLDSENEKEFNNTVKLAIAYVAEFYQIDKRIIRHRRLEIKDRLAARNLKEIKYPMLDSGYNYYERDVYDYILNYLEDIREVNGDKNLVCEYVKIFLSATFSSPWALQSLLELRESVLSCGVLRENRVYNSGISSTPRREKARIKNVNECIRTFSGEKEYLIELLDLNKKWMSAVEAEFEEFDEKFENSISMNGRINKIIDYISKGGKDKKFVLFTSHIETAKKYEELLKAKFGDDSTTSFHCEMDELSLELSAYKFQEVEYCRFMICDELGGEGRNFQEADEIIHIDIPWTPVQIEQRIGRLDRIGRGLEKGVTSVVLYTSGSIEEDLFRIWNEGLNIFKESLSGIEIILGEIHSQIMKAFSSDISYGLKNILDEIIVYSETMRKKVEEERYYDMARQLDKRTIEGLMGILSELEAKNDRNFGSVARRWCNILNLRENVFYYDGSGVMYYATKQYYLANKRNGKVINGGSLYVPPDLYKIYARPGDNPSVRGTFNRDVALRKEDIVFFSPGETFFESLLSNAVSCNKGRCCSYAIEKCDINWKGFALIWNIDINLEHLLRLGESLENAVLIQGYIPPRQIVTFVPLEKKYSDIEDHQIVKELERGYNILHCTDLGQRNYAGKRMSKNLPNAEWFKQKYPHDMWTNKVKSAVSSAKKEAVQKLSEQIKIEQARTDFDKLKYGMRASGMYYGRGVQIEDARLKRLNKIYEALIKGLEEAQPVLDSMVYVWMVKDGEKLE